MAVASTELQLALTLAEWTGQRQGDLLSLQWSDYADGCLRLCQSKTKRWVTIPVEETLAEWLASAPKRALTVVTGQRGKPWTSSGFKTEWRKARIAAGIDDVTFHDTFVARRSQSLR